MCRRPDFNFLTDESLLILQYSQVVFGARKNLTKNNMYCIIVDNKKIKWSLMGYPCRRYMPIFMP